MNAWRKHQRELITIAELMRYTPSIKYVIAEVTPGGGKSALPVILAHYLIPLRVQKLAWITPRDNLRTQGEESFSDSIFRSLLGHNLEIRATTAQVDPSRSSAGFITTYQSIVADTYGLFAAEFNRYRYALILDENQHAARGSDYEKALQPLVDKASAVLFMSGCLVRSDNGFVAFLPYLPPAGGKSFVDLSDSATQRVIRYSLRDALEERAIIPMWFELLDGNASWECRGKEFKAEHISEVDNGEIGSAIYTTLRTDFAFHLLTQTVEHWRNHRQHNPRALLLIVAPSQEIAEKYLQWLRKMHVGRCDIAISKESQLAKDNIRLFRQGHLDALVTVQMAYEGMDVRPITHIACLTHIRARPWVEQMLARATRYDPAAGPWEHQRAWIFAPDDKLFQEVMKDMQEIQEPFVRELLQTGGSGGTTGPAITTPISSSVDSVRATNLDANESVDASETADLQQRMKLAGLYGIATEHQMRMFEQAKPTSSVSHSMQTISQRETQLKNQIETWVRKNSYPLGPDMPKKINGAIVKRYGKSRTQMNEKELQRVWDERAIWSQIDDEP